MSKWMVYMLWAILANSSFAIFWKKSVEVVAFPIIFMFVGGTLFLFGSVNYISSYGTISVGVGKNLLWPVLLCAASEILFYPTFSKVLQMIDVSKAYPINAVGTIIIVSIVGICFMGEAVSFRKVIGLMLGMISVWLIKGK